MDQKTRFLVGKMLGLLGSDQDGEILAAAKAIRRLLEANRLTFADLVAAVSNGPVAVRGEHELSGMAHSIMLNESMMKPHERKFVRDVLARANMLANYELTPKQAKWFLYLYAKYGE